MYVHHMTTTLDLLYKEVNCDCWLITKLVTLKQCPHTFRAQWPQVPRVIVNVLGIMEIKDLRHIKKDSLGCSLIQE